MAEQYNSAHTGLEIDAAVTAALNLNAKNGAGERSIEEGYGTVASGPDSHAEGDTTCARGAASHAEGIETKAGGDISHAEGRGTVAVFSVEHVQGQFNIPSEDYDNPAAQTEPGMLHVVGNGTDDENRSNAHTLDFGGNAWFAGDVYVYSASGVNRDAGSKKLATEEFAQSCGGTTVKQYTGTLLADNWAADANGYLSQAIAIIGLKATYEIDPQWDIVLSGTDHDADMALLEGFSLICNFTTGAGSLTAQCLGIAPTVNLPIKVVAFG